MASTLDHGLSHSDTPTSGAPALFMEDSGSPAPLWPSERPLLLPSENKSATRIKRPRNAFILFRCDFVKRGVVPASVERDHRNISRIAGRTWRLMSPAQRRPWEQLAEREKLEHARLYPDYKYKPSPTRSASTQTFVDNKQRIERTRAEDDRCNELAHLAVQLREGEKLEDVSVHLSRRRSSSCPAPNAVARDLSSHHGTFDPDFFTRRETDWNATWNFGMVNESQSSVLVAPFELSSVSTASALIPNLDSRACPNIAHPIQYGHVVGAHNLAAPHPVSQLGAGYNHLDLVTPSAANDCVFEPSLSSPDYLWGNASCPIDSSTSQPLTPFALPSSSSSVYNGLVGSFDNFRFQQEDVPTYGLYQDPLSIEGSQPVAFRNESSFCTYSWSGA